MESLLSKKSYPNCFFLDANLYENLFWPSFQNQFNYLKPTQFSKLSAHSHQNLTEDRRDIAGFNKFSIPSVRGFQPFPTSLGHLGRIRALSSEKHRLSSGKILPLYEIDCRPPRSVFRKVNFSVEEVNSKYEKLFLELYTNGSLSPLFAFECARHKVLGILRFCQL